MSVVLINEYADFILLKLVQGTNQSLLTPAFELDTSEGGVANIPIRAYQRYVQVGHVLREKEARECPTYKTGIIVSAYVNAKNGKFFGSAGSHPNDSGTRANMLSFALSLYGTPHPSGPI